MVVWYVRTSIEWRVYFVLRVCRNANNPYLATNPILLSLLVVQAGTKISSRGHIVRVIFVLLIK